MRIDIIKVIIRSRVIPVRLIIDRSIESPRPVGIPNPMTRNMGMHIV